MKQRYDSYKSSGIDWIGEIPSHWELPRVKQFVKINNGSDPKTEGDIPVYGSGSGSFKTCGEYKIGPTVLLGRKGATLHIPHWVEGKYWNVDTAFDTKIIKGLHFRLFFYLSTLFDYNRYKSETTLPSMTQTDYGNMYIPLPPIGEQEAITAWLDETCGEIDAAIAKVDREIELIDDLKQSEISRVVTRGLNPDALLRPSGIDWIGDIPSHWKVKRLRFVCEFRNGYTPSKDNKNFWTDGTIPWYRMEDLRDSGRFLNEAKQYITEEAIKGGGLFEAGSFILATTATIGEHAMLIVDSLANQQFTNLKIRKSLSDNVIKEFFYYYLFVIDEFCKSTTKTTTFPAMDMTDLKNFGVCLPPLSEQQAIADYLDKKCAEIDGLKAKLVKKREILKELRQSIISEVVTGKRKVI